jgi:hypothetical protein
MLIELNSLATKLLGLRVNEAEGLLRGGGHSYRLAKEDGVSMMLTMENLPTRFNLEVEDGVVVNVTMG